MVEGRTQKPVIDETKCLICGVCMGHCPAEVFVEHRKESDSIRGTLYRGQGSGISTKREENPSPPCQEACPIGQDVPGYVSLIAQGRFAEALDVVRRTNPLPAVCGLVCHHPCEDACRRASLDSPVAIRMVKEFLAAYAPEKEKPPRRGSRGKRSRGQRVAVVGAGPTGLTAGYDLTQMGYQVTIFETLPTAGGMLWVGIPEFRLPRRILKREIDAILDGGVELRTGQALGQSFSLDDLRVQGFEAFLIATGAHRSQRLRIEGERLEGVIGGVEFLRKVNLGEEIALGDRVAVIGGGNVAIDSARSALRHGSREVEIYYRRSRQEMPAIAEEIDQARQEGVHIHWLTTPSAFVGSSGKVTGAICIKNRLGPKDTSGRRVPIPIPGSEHRVAVDSVIAAVGQETGARDLGVEIDVSRDGTIRVDRETGATSAPGIFAGGDVVTGPGWAIDAIAWGKRAARGIHAYLSGSHPQPRDP